MLDSATPERPLSCLSYPGSCLEPLGRGARWPGEALDACLSTLNFSSGPGSILGMLIIIIIFLINPWKVIE